MPNDMVLTPGGFRPKSLVNFVEPGRSFEDMSKMMEPLKTQLPEVWKWAQTLQTQ